LDLFRSAKIELLGFGIGSIDRPDLQPYMRQYLPELQMLNIAGKQSMDAANYLSDIIIGWACNVADKSVVVEIK
jgi:hypothetical protein